MSPCVMSQTFFSQKVLKRKLGSQKVFKGHSKSTTRALKEYLGIWALGCSSHLGTWTLMHSKDTWTLSHLDTRALGFSGHSRHIILQTTKR